MHTRIYPLSLLIIIAIVLLSLLPFNDVRIAAQVPFADKWTHMVMYFTLTAVVWAEHLYRNAQPRWGYLLGCGVLGSVVLGGLMELAQAYLTTYRSGDWWDFAADCVGVAAGTLVGAALTPITAKRRAGQKNS